jgi:voltage-gated potassium channel
MESLFGKQRHFCIRRIIQDEELKVKSQKLQAQKRKNMKLKTIIEDNDTAAGRAFDISIQILIGLSLTAFSIETLPNLSPRIIIWLERFELVSVIIFSLEYILRIVVADNRTKFIFSFYGLIDFIAIFPFYITSGIDLRAVRVFRLMRILRAFKIIRYNRAMRRYADAFGAIKEELYIFLIATLFLLFVSSVGIYYFENPAQPSHFSSVFQCMWWSLATLTTVGYGDVYPITVGGKIFTFFILMAGLGIIAVPTALIASALTKSIQDEKEETTK